MKKVKCKKCGSENVIFDIYKKEFECEDCLEKWLIISKKKNNKSKIQILMNERIMGITI